MMFDAILQNLAFVILLGLMLFIPAGTLDWPQAWVFLALIEGCGLAVESWLRKIDPELLAERMKSPVSADQKPRDRLIVIALLTCFAGWIVFMALDARRFGWSHAPHWMQAIGAALIIIVFYLWGRVLRENSFASPKVRLQKERGQIVVTTGPYALVRHPMYADAIIFFIGAPLLLGSLWGLLWIILFVPLLGLRALGEEAMLMEGLPGYRDYVGKVRFRLLPGIW